MTTYSKHGRRIGRPPALWHTDAHRLAASGMSTREIATHVGRAVETVRGVLNGWSHRQQNKRVERTRRLVVPVRLSEQEFDALTHWGQMNTPPLTASAYLRVLMQRHMGRLALYKPRKMPEVEP